MTVNEVVNGIVLDHIRAGQAMEIYRFLRLGELDCAVAILQRVPSRKMGRKDIIKIDAALSLDLQALGYLDAGITVNIIRDGKLVDKQHLTLPDRLTNVIRCHNPRCITSVEQELPHVFTLTDRAQRVYRCLYCESAAKQ